MGKTTVAARKDADEYFKYVEIKHKIAHMTGMVYIKNPDRAEMELAAEIHGYEQKMVEAGKRFAEQKELQAAGMAKFALREKAFAEETDLLAKTREEVRVGHKRMLEDLQTQQEANLQKESGTAEARRAISAKKTDIASVKPYLKRDDWDAMLDKLNNLIKEKAQTPAPRGAKSSSSKQKPGGDDLVALNKQQETIYKIKEGKLNIEAGKPYLSDIVAQMQARLDSELREDRLAIEKLDREIGGSKTSAKKNHSKVQQTRAGVCDSFSV